MSDLAQLLLPALRWDAERGFAPLEAEIERSIALGVGGFIIFGGERNVVARLTHDLRSASRHPLLIASDLERGAGQQFAGCTGLPPLAALGSLDDLGAVSLAARLTAREALALGVNWSYSPVADLDLEPDNPIVGTRSLGADAAKVAAGVEAFVDAMQGEGMLACAKHFPGHGRTIRDSHAELPIVSATRAELEADLIPFRAAIDAGVASIMTAHVAFPALDPSGAPATCSRPIITNLLREELGFEGLVVTDALIMAGVRDEGGEGHAAGRAVSAGCDLLLYPHDPASALYGLEVAAGRTAPRAQLDASLARRDYWARWASQPESARPVSDDDIANAHRIARRCVHLLRGWRLPEIRRLEVAIIDDDLGGPYPPPSRLPFIESLGEEGLEVILRDAQTAERIGRPFIPTARETLHSTPLVIALFGDIRAWKGRPGYSPAARAHVAELVRMDAVRARDVIIVQLSHPRLAAELPGEVPIVCAWGGEAPMQRAAAMMLGAR
ncbi:MAG: glycoside hydrolase family 3 N-terminal domain-containing protein [Gemmatimonadaceae bacterium]